MRSVTKRQAEQEVEQAVKKHHEREATRDKKAKPVAYPQEIQDMITLFMAERKEDALEAFKSAQTVAAIAPTVPGTMGQLEYWRRVIQAIEWIESYIPRRQRHLRGVKF